jgi:anhydro-N-acetylmuramic acid kinase
MTPPRKQPHSVRFSRPTGSGARDNASRSRLVFGLMSGTSADAIDVALVRIAPRAPNARSAQAPARLENFTTLPYPRAVRAAVLRIAEGAASTSGEISQLNFRLGQVFAQAVLHACKKFRVNPRRISLIGSHGQTIYHQGLATPFAGRPVASTMQIGEPALIAALTGITTVGDFRPADIAVGGQGAPLVPFVDYLLYRDSRHSRVALNIGGIANLTVIPRRARPQDLFAFDIGPGNMVIDAAVRHFTRERQTYDRDARMALRGQTLFALLDRLLADPYFRQPPPKTAGREQFGHAYAQRILNWGAVHQSGPADLVRTATLFTALSIVDAVHRWVSPRTRVTQLIIAGGGARNPLIVAQLRAALGGIEILSSDSFGVPGDAKEAFAFALLADETFHQRPSNLPSATGAARPAILGKICYAPPN